MFLFRATCLLVCLASLSFGLFSQSTWSLQQCIDYALQNSINVKQVELQKDQVEVNLKQSKIDAGLPDINLSSSYNFNFANSLDPTTFEFVDQTTQTATFGLNGSLTLFQGLQQLNTIERNKLQNQAAYFTLEDTRRNVALNVATLYLQALFNKELVEQAILQQTLTKEQISNSQALIEAGVLAGGEILDLEAQLAGDELNLVNAQNAYDISLVQLKLLMRLPASSQIEISSYEVSEDQLSLPVSSAARINDYAAANDPGVKSADLNVQSASREVDIAKGNFSPSVTLSGNLRSNYINTAKEVIGLENLRFNTIGFVEGTGSTVFSNTPSGDVITEKLTFGNQLDENFNQSVSLNFSLPLTTGWQRKAALDRARINLLSSELDLERAQNDLTQRIYEAYTSALASERSYIASKKRVGSLRNALSYAEEKFNLGAMNSIDFFQVRNAYFAAESDLIQSKYDYLFKIKVLDFYKGLPLRLN